MYSPLEGRGNRLEPYQFHVNVARRENQTVFHEIAYMLESEDPRVAIAVPKHVHEDVDETRVKKNSTGGF